MKQFIACLAFSAFLFTSCIEKCQTCVLDDLEVEICEEGLINYTDANGNPIGDYDETIKEFENNGYECN